jgi:ribonuclease-3
MAATGWSVNGAIRAGVPPHLRADRAPVAPFDCCALRPPGAVVFVSGATGDRQLRATRGGTVPDWKELEARLRLRFKNPNLLKQALVHTSYLNENPGIGVGSNERLEFLGDAALGVVVAQQLYNEYPDVDEGKLTELRAHLVRRDTLARAAARFELGEYLQLGRGEDAAGGRRRPTNMARAYEALVGAIFLDGGIAAVRAFVRRTLKDELQGLRKKGMPHDPKSRLQEVIQSRWQTTPSYKLLKTEGPDHARRFTVQVMVGGKPLGTGEGRSKQMAEKEAAQHALNEIEQQEIA